MAFWIAWLVGLFVHALDQDLGPSGELLGWIPLLIVSMPVAFLPAFAVPNAFSRVTSHRQHLSTLTHPRGNVIWFLVALLAFRMTIPLGMVIVAPDDG
jgi:hypothetical protein